MLIPELDYRRSKNIGGFSIDKNIRNNLAIDAKNRRALANFETDTIHNVMQWRLDDFCFEEQVTFVKLDVEGKELEVLFGAKATLESSGYPPIILEIWEGRAWYARKAEETKKFLNNLGYKLFRIGPNVLAQHPGHSSFANISIGDRVGGLSC